MLIASVWSVAPAEGVILVDREERNLAPPGGTLLSAWNFEGSYYGYNATPIGPDSFISAKHIGAREGADITFAGDNFHTTSFTDVPGTDLRIFKINTLNGTHLFPSYASLFDSAVDGSEIGKPMAVFGRGTARGEAIYAATPSGPSVAPVRPPTAIALTSTSAPTPTPSQSGNLRGWAWAANDGQESWGRNVVDSVVDDDVYGQLLRFSFSAGPNRVPDEGGLSGGDSGGGMFIYSGGEWKLAGVHLGADGSWSFSPTGAFFNASIFDARGLFVGSRTASDFVPYDNSPVESSSYSTRIGGANLSAIRAMIGGTSTFGGGPIVVPEPTATLLAVSVLSTQLLRRRARRL